MMADLARHLGLARSTVSMALHNDPLIAPATRQRVQDVARELGYRTNPLVSALMSNLQAAHRQRPGTVLAVVREQPQPDDWHRQPLLHNIDRGIAARAARHGFTLQSFLLGEKGLTAARTASILRARGIPGVILAPAVDTKPGSAEDWNDFAAVTIGWSIADPRLSRSSFHHFQNVLLAWDTLAERGYRRIGLLHTAGPIERSGLTYLGGYLARSHLLPVRSRVAPLAVAHAPSLTPDAVRAWLVAQRPDAVIVTDAACFVPLLQQVAAVPAALGVAALELGNAPAGTAGIDEGSFRVGALAVDLLIEQLHRNQRGVSDVPSYLHVPGVWRDGATLRAPASVAA